MKKLLLLIWVMGAGLLVSGGAHAFGIGTFGADHTGFADAGLGCGSCHGASFHGNTTVTLLIEDAGLNDVTAGPLLSSTVYTLTVTITEDAPMAPDQWGFQLQVLQDTDNMGSGTLVAGINSHINTINGVDFWAHDDVNQNSFSTTWTSDATGNDVTFYYAGVSAVEAGGTGQTSRVTNLTTSTALDVPAVADLSVTIGNDAEFVPEDALDTFEFWINNNSDNDVSGARALWAMPGALASATWVCDPMGTGTCAAVGSGSIDELVSINANNSMLFLITIEAIAGMGPLTMTATVEPPAEPQDPNLANNTASDTDPIAVFASSMETAD